MAARRASEAFARARSLWGRLREWPRKRGPFTLDRYTSEAKQLVAGAQQIADERQHAEVAPLHLLMRLLERDRGVAEVFAGRAGTPTLGEVMAADRTAP